MPTNPELELGPYRLVRLHRSPHIRIYTVENRESGRTIALLIRVAAPDLGLPEEWQLRCQEPGCPGTAQFSERDRTLTWLGRHRVTKHPDTVRREGA